MPSDDSKKLVLVDAYSLLFRAHFSNPYLTAPDGSPTGALFGFSNMLLSILSNQKPNSIVICWDGPQRTHRKEEYEAYKAHRPEVDPNLVLQMPGARKLVEAFGIQSAELPGYEADDLIGTLSVRGSAQGFEVVIVTGDSDQLQLVKDSVRVEICQRGVTEVKDYNAAAVEERYGVPPSRLPDWKGLVGDTSDNIPGVPGIGEKTATALLQKFGDMETLLQHVPEVTPNKARLALEEYADQARLSKRLATIVCDAPFELSVEPYAPTDGDWNQVRELFQSLKFRSLLSRLPQPAVPPPPSPPASPSVAAQGSLFSFDEPEVDAVDSAASDTAADSPIQIQNIADHTEFVAAMKAVHVVGLAALTIETELGSPLKLKSIRFAASGDKTWTANVSAQPPDISGGLFDEGSGFSLTADDLIALLNPSKVKLVCHNAKPTLHAITTATNGQLNPEIAFDTMIAAYLLDSGRSTYPVSDLAQKYLNRKGDIAADAEPAILLGLADAMQKHLDALNMTDVMARVELPLVTVLAQVERVGLLVDRSYLSALSLRLNRDMIDLASDIYRITGEEFNIGSPKQLQVVLFEKLQLPTGKKNKSGFTTGADLLEALAPEYPIARLILDYREISKLKSTYADALVKLMDPQTGRVHTTLNQTVASTGRLSSSDPNLQNIPIRSELGREIRRAFIAPPGKVLLSCDYSQIELRILAHMSSDAALTEAFNAHADVHAATASRVFGVPLAEVTSDQRRQAKTINFAVIYGQSAFALASTLGVDNKTAGAWIKEYFNRLPGVQQFIAETTASAHTNRYVSTLLGRRRYLPELDSPNHAMRQFAERAAVNMPIQGTAADIMKLAMIDVFYEVQRNWSGVCRMLLQVHDELLFEVDVDAVDAVTPVIRGIMENVYPLSVPLTAEAKSGPNWADMKQ